MSDNKTPDEHIQFPVREIFLRNTLREGFANGMDAESMRISDEVAKELAIIEEAMTYNLKLTIPGGQTPDTISAITKEISRCIEEYKGSVLKKAILPLIIRLLKAEGRWVH